MKPRRLHLLIPVLALIAGLILPDISSAADKKGNVEVNFIYAFQLGFGSYNVGGLDVQVYSLPLSYTFNDFLGNEKLKLVVDTPVFYGRFRYRETVPDGTRIKVDQDMMSVIPGVELQWEPVEHWHIKPFINAGLAWQVYDSSTPNGLSVDDSFVLVYAAGLGSLYQMFWEKFTFSLGNRLSWAGNTNFHESTEQSFGLLENGIDVKHPLGFSYKGYEPDVSVFFNWYYFIPDTTFDRAFKPPLEVVNQFEIAGTVGFAKPTKVWILSDPRIGVGYRFGDLDAFAVNFGFPF
jgi:hypothetical protein